MGTDSSSRKRQEAVLVSSQVSGEWFIWAELPPAEPTNGWIPTGHLFFIMAVPSFSAAISTAASYTFSASSTSSSSFPLVHRPDQCRCELLVFKRWRRKNHLLMTVMIFLSKWLSLLAVRFHHQIHQEFTAQLGAVNHFWICSWKLVSSLHLHFRTKSYTASQETVGLASTNIRPIDSLAIE